MEEFRSLHDLNTIQYRFLFPLPFEEQKLCAEKFGWKKSTTYTFIKKLCENGIFKNENAIVSSVLNKEEYHRAQGEAFVEKAYGGSLPKMIAAFIQSKKLSAAQIAEIEAMIEDYKG